MCTLLTLSDHLPLRQVQLYLFAKQLQTTARNELKIDKLDNVHSEEVQVPLWVRGEESAQMILPRNHSVALLGLGSSVGTPPDGITAEVLVVRSFDELHANAVKVCFMFLHKVKVHKLLETVSSHLHVQWNPDFSNPRFFEPPDNSNQKLFPLLSRTLQFYPRFLELSDFSNQFSFPLEVRKIGIPALYMKVVRYSFHYSPRLRV